MKIRITATLETEVNPEDYGDDGVKSCLEDYNGEQALDILLENEKTKVVVEELPG